MSHKFPLQFIQPVESLFTDLVSEPQSWLNQSWTYATPLTMDLKSDLDLWRGKRGKERREDCDLSSIIQSMLACCWISFLSMPIKCLHFAIIFLVCIDLPAEFSELVHLNSIPLEGTSYSRLSDYQNKSVCKITSHTSRVGLAICVWDYKKSSDKMTQNINSLTRSSEREREICLRPCKSFSIQLRFSQTSSGN